MTCHLFRQIENFETSLNSISCSFYVVAIFDWPLEWRAADTRPKRGLFWLEKGDYTETNWYRLAKRRSSQQQSKRDYQHERSIGAKKSGKITHGNAHFSKAM